MTAYYSSDWHLGHARIIELCGRPFDSVEEMNRAIINGCNETVGENDTLYLLGDTVMGKYSENVKLLGELTCKNVVLFPGNHDRWSLAYGHSAEKREQYALELEGMGFTVIRDEKPSRWTRLFGATEVNVSHYPYAGDSQDEDRHADMRPVDDGKLLIHGHVHEKWRSNGRMLNVGVDVWGVPVSETRILSLLG